MPKIDITAAPSAEGSDYPPPFEVAARGRVVRALGAAAGLNQLAVSHATIPPGGWSAQRHWHEGEDEFVVVLDGEGVLVDGDGRTAMRAGDCAAFRAGDRNGHHLVNDSDRPLVLLAFSIPEATPCHYPDIGLRWDAATDSFADEQFTDQR